MVTHATPGLSTEIARRLLAEHGPNALPEPRGVPLWLRLARQLRNPLIYILLFALAFDLGSWVLEGRVGWPAESIVIAAVLLLNSALGALQELRSEQALAKLKTLSTPVTWVVRDGRLVEVPSSELVPGDIARLEAGERVPADGVIIEAHGLLLDEAVLTGESVPVDKAPWSEAFSGTLLVRGKGLLRVEKTGAASTMGQLATMLGSLEAGKTPLEKRLGALGEQVAWWVGIIAVVLGALGLLAEGLGRFGEVVLFTVALAVAAVPEGMPAVVTLTLALGVQRMAKRKALVRRLSAVEALGSVTVIATDKTGTLTENRMTVHDLDAPRRREALVAMAVANDAEPDSGAGDPLEAGLLRFAAGEGLDAAAARAARPRRSLRAFDSAWKFMRVSVDEAGRAVSYLKGAPEVLLARASLSPDEAARWSSRAEQAATEGYRVLALARGEGEDEEGLVFLGLVMLWDPPRVEVPAAIAKAQAAGVRVLMITGDHPATARTIAERVGLSPVKVLTGADIAPAGSEALRQMVRSTNVFARVSAEDKLRLVEALQANGEIVAMTGDGVNDAPALKRADVGVAMGKRGSEVTREVADLVLLDDNFATIVGAIEEGRSIYENIQTFVRYTFSTNIALLLLVVAGAIGAYAEGLRGPTGMLILPLTALQLLWVNFLGDGPPALALATDRTEGLMSQPPRPAKSDLLDAPSRRFIAASGAIKGLLGVALLLALPVLGATLVATQTAIFLFESIGKLVSAYPARTLSHARRPNLVLNVSIALGVVLQIATLTVPSLRGLLSLSPLGPEAMALVTLAIALAWAGGEAANAWARRAPRAVGGRPAGAAR